MVKLQSGCYRLLQHQELLQLLPSAVQRWSDTQDQAKALKVTVQLLTDAWSTLERATETAFVAAQSNGVAEGDGEHSNSATDNGYGEDYYDEDYDGDEGEEYGMYDEDAEEYSDEEEKSKVRKKRKLEAKSRKAAKKAKLESGDKAAEDEPKPVVVNKPPITIKVIDSALITDIVQCIFTLAVMVYEINNTETVQCFEKLIDNINEYVGSNYKNDSKKQFSEVLLHALLSSLHSRKVALTHRKKR